jgi:hypothetical protein
VVSDEAVPLPGILPGASAEPAYRYLSPHQAAVLNSAIRRLVSKADIDPPEHVVIYIDHLLSMFDVARTGRLRVVDLRDHYVGGIALLDRLAAGDFTAVSRLCQELILSRRQVTPFADLLFDHIVEAMYVAPKSNGSAPRNRSVSSTRRTRAYR